MYDPLCRKLAQELGAILVSVEYRKAPTHIFPAAIDDSFAAAKYFIKHVKKYKINPKRIAIMGDSAGGNLAAAVTQRLKDELVTPLPKMQILMYPALQAIDFNTPSMIWNENGPLLTKSFMVWFYNHYIFGHQYNFDLMLKNNHTHPHIKQNMPLKYMKPDHLPADEQLQNYHLPKGRLYGDIEFWNYYKPTFMSPYLAPLMTRTSDIAGLPHTYIVSCQYDVLRDDAFHYAARLRKENVSVEHVNLHECYHGWFSEYIIRTVDTFGKHFNQFIGYIDDKL